MTVHSRKTLSFRLPVLVKRELTRNEIFEPFYSFAQAKQPQQYNRNNRYKLFNVICRGSPEFYNRSRTSELRSRVLKNEPEFFGKYLDRT